MSERKLTNKTREYLDKSAKERIIYCGQDKWVGYKAAEKLLDLLEDKFNEPEQIRREGLLIYGDYHNGKTAILKKFYDTHKASMETRNEKGERLYEIPIIRFDAPTIPDENRLYGLILDQLCVPYQPRDNVMVRARVAEHYLAKLNTKMIMIDEIHSALTGNLNKQRTFINDLKQLSNKLSLSIVLVGTREAHSALTSNGEIESRFPSIELPQWSNDKRFRSFVATYETCLPLKEASNMVENPQIIDAIYNNSQGNIGRAVNLIKKAAVKAIKSGKERIVLSDIEYLPTL
jgi:hypothetical protein